VNIRPADPERDAAGCAAIYGPFVERTAISFEEHRPSEHDFAQRISTITKAHPWLIAEEHDDIIGYAYGCPHRERAAYRWAAEVTVYVDPSQQRRRIGTTLYKNLFELLQQQGIHVLCAGVTLPNPASVALHESLGFVPVGIYKKIGFKHGRWHDVGWWQLALRPQTDDPPEEPTAPKQ
jgi:L-amino acid N-acyltransferase YncA